ncbi:hypothetical protein [Streptomyces physcomitrii]|uniref:Uncharacterized protein n=1 Tax=Streptomyces physcomitrii TaxID=2724184 RepID=A0ABX1H4C8_9ACTN|nr:hypothetical protein [Streptomyces physcomitrii]NKI42873.1 hypothetical protein [Streptomyces physcomitrii]
MIKRLGTAFGTALVAAVAFTAPASAAEAPADHQALTSRPGTAAESAADWSYDIDGSCDGYEDSIREGANYWESASEGDGTPVDCVSGYVEGCEDSRGGEPVYQAGGVIGCNWGRGDKITLSTDARDFALIAAHEFGHNWWDHSDYDCMSWDSQDEVMAPTMCD